LIKGFFFDLDGTLVNTYRADYLAYRDAVKEVIGQDLKEVEYAALHGMEIGAKLTRLLPGLSEGQVAGIRQSKKKHYPEYVHLTEANDSLISFLAQLAKHQVCALVTSAKHDNVASVISHHNLKQFFTHIVSGDDVSQHKPHPEAYNLALQKTGLQAHQVLAFEDSESGIKSAEAAGIPVIHIKEFAAP
jgi:HAD superfamily hydrolase (TIGR01509 family)